MRFKFIHAERANYPVRVMCRVLRVSTSGYYAQMKRAPSKRQCEDGKLKLRIQAIHAHSRGTYGRERVRRQLDGENVEVGKQRVARLMREMGLQGLPSKRFRRTTDSKHDRPIAPNVLGRNFEAERPNQFWVTDITYIRTWEGWLYLAVILDLFSRRVVGWAMQPPPARGACSRGASHGLGAPPAGKWLGASFRPWYSIRGCRPTRPCSMSTASCAR